MRDFPDLMRPLRLDGPVETEEGESMRQRAFGVMRARWEGLTARSGEFAFSQLETDHLRALGRSLSELEAMAPRGPLVPRGHRDWFSAKGFV